MPHCSSGAHTLQGVPAHLPYQVLWDLLGPENSPAVPCSLHPCPSRAQKPTPRCGSYSCSQKGLARPSLLRAFRGGGGGGGKSGSPVTFLTLLAGKAEGASGKACPVSASRRATLAPTLAPLHPSPPSCDWKDARQPAMPLCLCLRCWALSGRGSVLQEHTAGGSAIPILLSGAGAEVASSPKNS